MFRPKFHSVTIEIENHSGRALKDLSTFFFKGTADFVPLPNDVHDGKMEFKHTSNTNLFL